MKTYRIHNCQKTHRKPEQFMKCAAPWARTVQGSGGFAVIVRCLTTRIEMFGTEDAAERHRRSLDRATCGQTVCRGNHEVIKVAGY